MATYPGLPKYTKITTLDDLVNILNTYTNELTRELDLRDRQQDNLPSTKIYTVTIRAVSLDIRGSQILASRSARARLGSDGPKIPAGLGAPPWGRPARPGGGNFPGQGRGIPTVGTLLHGQLEQ